MRFDVAAEHALFAESVRSAIGDWRPPREPDLGDWQDDRDDALAVRVAEAGWDELWAGDELLGAVVAGGLELGRADEVVYEAFEWYALELLDRLVL